MSVIYIVLPLAFLFAAGFVGLFIWAVRQGQMDDLHTPAARILLDEEPSGPPRERSGADDPNRDGRI